MDPSDFQHTLSRRLRRFLRRDDGPRPGRPLVHGARERAPRHAILLTSAFRYSTVFACRRHRHPVRRDVSVCAPRASFLERRPERASLVAEVDADDEDATTTTTSREFANGASHHLSRSVARVVESRHRRSAWSRRVHELCPRRQPSCIRQALGLKRWTRRVGLRTRRSHSPRRRWRRPPTSNRRSCASAGKNTCALPLLSRVFGRHCDAVALAFAFASSRCCAPSGRAPLSAPSRITVGTTVGAAAGISGRLFRGSIAMDDDERHVPERKRAVPSSNDPGDFARLAPIDSYDEVIRLNNFYAKPENRELRAQGDV